MKKIALTLTLFIGLTAASYACQAAYENLLFEIDQHGNFDSWEELEEAYDDWVDVSC